MKTALQAGVAALFLHLVLVLPNYPPALGWGRLTIFPLELPVILLACVALGATRMFGVFRGGVTVILTVMVVLKSADLVSFSALSRPFNPVSDLALIEAFARLLSGTFGVVLAGLAMLATILAVACVAVAAWWSLGVWGRVRLPLRPVAGVAAASLAAITVADVGAGLERWDLPVSVPGSASTTRLAVTRTELAVATFGELRDFRIRAARDPFADAEGLFSAVDRDVLMIFVESYGRTSFETAQYADLHLETLARYEALIGAQGTAMRSGFLTSPTQGGQSWLAHATLSNGMWVDNQPSYGAALASGRQTLFHHAGRAGFHTATVMPQITLDWPEVARMGFEDVLVADDLGYEGLAFNWVTMPDQFTLAALDRLLRGPGRDPRRLFAQVALVSSHAPWVPIPQIYPWEDLGNGTIYNATVLAGDPPEVVWRDYDRVRAQYRLAVDYALQSVMEYVLLQGQEPPLIMVVGDHQAAEFIARDDRAQVPVHVIGPDALVSRLSSIAPYEGLIPAPDAPALPMQDVRDAMLRALSDEDVAGIPDDDANGNPEVAN